MRIRIVMAASAVVALALTAAACSKTNDVAGSSAGSGAIDKKDLVLVTSIITQSNEYQLNSVDGAQAFADSVGVPLKVVNSNVDSQQEISQIQAIVASGKKAVVLVNPVSSADVPAIVKSVSAAGGYVVTQWNKPDDYQPTAAGDHYVAHMGFDGIAAGEYIATKLFQSMGGKGGVIALQGALDSTAGQQRYEGFKRALKKFPQIKELDAQAANWDEQQGYTVTRTLEAKYGSQIKGVWGACDAMSLGALSALRGAGLNDVKYVGMDGDSKAIHELQTGNNYVATWASDPWYNGAIGLALGYAAATGKLDVSKMTDEQRNGTYKQVGVDKANVAEWATKPTAAAIIAEVDKGLFDRLEGPAITSAASK